YFVRIIYKYYTRIMRYISLYDTCVIHVSYHRLLLIDLLYWCNITIITLGRKTTGGFNPHKELQRRVDDFLKSPKAETVGMHNRPDFYETLAILFLMQHDDELA